MMYKNFETYFDKPVVDFGIEDSLDDFTNKAIRLRCSYDDTHTISDLLSRLLRQPGVGGLEALVIGLWMEGGEAYDVSPDDIIEHMVTEKAKLAGLKALFVGDIISEENEISWIGQGNMAPLWPSFPKLERFGARGSNGLRLGRINHDTLTHLTIETGGLPLEVTREALDSRAPLTHLELWLGTDEYGGTTTLEDLAPLLDGELFPDLRYLGLRNCMFGDDLAEAVAKSAVLGRIDVLDLSMGTVGDRGAEALLNSGQIGHLSLLDLTHHYAGDEAIKALGEQAPNVRADDPQKPETYGEETYYHVAVSE